MHRLHSCSRMCQGGGNVSGTLEGGRMGDNLECLGDISGLILAFVYRIITWVRFMSAGPC